MATKKQILHRKNKATPKTIEIILEVISEGLTQREASILAGISEDTLSLWKRQDSDFSEQIRQKQIENKLRHIRVINEASKTKWQASAWWLERKFKEEFSVKGQEGSESSESIDKLTEAMQKLLTPPERRV